MIIGLGHAAVRTKDIEASVKFYTNIMGFKEAFRVHNQETGNLNLVYLYIAPGQFIELFPNGSGEQSENGNIGIKHICIEVDDIKKARDELAARGAPIDVDIKTGQSKCIQFWTHDPDGTKIELMELPPESLHAQANKRFQS